MKTIDLTLKITGAVSEDEVVSILEQAKKQILTGLFCGFSGFNEEGGNAHYKWELEREENETVEN